MSDNSSDLISRQEYEKYREEQEKFKGQVIDYLSLITQVVENNTKAARAAQASTANLAETMADIVQIQSHDSEILNANNRMLKALFTHVLGSGEE
jgi:hypothetical protein